MACHCAIHSPKWGPSISCDEHRPTDICGFTSRRVQDSNDDLWLCSVKSFLLGEYSRQNMIWWGGKNCSEGEWWGKRSIIHDKKPFFFLEGFYLATKNVIMIWYKYLQDDGIQMVLLGIEFFFWKMVYCFSVVIWMITHNFPCHK